jgi:hypothetical protein
MERILDRVLDPAIVWVFIPLLAILFWGLNGMLRSLRGVPQEFEEWKHELRQLRVRVDELEQVQQRQRQPGGAPPVGSPGRPV